VLGQFDKTAQWAKFAKPGNWPDADMLPLGALGPVPGEGKPRMTRLTPDEQKTVVTLWAMARSPLILGANLTLLDDATRTLLTNPLVIRIDQTSVASRMVKRDGDVVAWVSEMPDGPTEAYALALFNLGNSPTAVTEDLRTYGLMPKNYRLMDVWSGQEFGKSATVDGVWLQPHACALFLLRK
jgi:hypothetical protein